MKATNSADDVMLYLQYWDHCLFKKAAILLGYVSGDGIINYIINMSYDAVSNFKDESYCSRMR